MNEFVLGQTVSSEQRARLIHEARRQPRPWLWLDPADVTNAYNRKPFVVRHRLAEQEFFELPALFALCKRLRPPYVACRAGVVPVDVEFDTSIARYNAGLTIADLEGRLEERQGYIVINNPESDPQYRPVIEGLLGELAAQIEPVDPEIRWYSTYVFISAQGSVTPYHMDREMNFLLQIRGTKLVQLWDPFDDDIMSSEQRDLLLSHVGSRPTYRPSFDAKAMSFRLEPGLGVHHPFIAPHLVRTGAELSVSLAITFRTAQSDVWANAHRVNYRLRQMGLSPRPVRRSAAVDRAKAVLLGAYRRTARVKVGSM